MPSNEKRRAAGSKRARKRDPGQSRERAAPRKPVGSRERTGTPKTRSKTLRVRKGVTGGHDGLPGTGTAASARSRARHIARSRPAGPAAAAMPAEAIAAGVLSGDRTILARAITLVESHAPAHMEKAQAVLQALMPHTGGSIRVGVTGVPGAGKSTLIEALGSHLTSRGRKVAVTAVDPSSSLSGGSILGDKTRMERLANDPRAFIRPSPTGGALGGVARKTRETILLFEAAGYDVVLVETVGVGQSEILVRSMVDFFLLLLIAGAGDELQGIKKGVIELADAIVVNKADGDNRIAAEVARGEYERALHYLRPATEGWETRAFAVSAATGEGIAEAWGVVEAFRACAQASGAWVRRRSGQEREWLHALLRERLWDLFRARPDVAHLLPKLEREVTEGRLPATTAAQRLLGMDRA